MHCSREKRFSHHAIKRVVKEARLRVLQREDELYNRDVLEALQEMTGLAHAELAGIADRFFSIKHQLLLACGFLIVFPGVPAIWLWMHH
jgi:NaMN:DMB phosphoribosyltransferase